MLGLLGPAGTRSCAHRAADIHISAPVTEMPTGKTAADVLPAIRCKTAITGDTRLLLADRRTAPDRAGDLDDVGLRPVPRNHLHVLKDPSGDPAACHRPAS